MARRSTRVPVARRQAVLAAIARREWLLQMLAVAAAGCRRREDPAYLRSNTLIAGVNGGKERPLTPDEDAEYLVYLPLVRVDAQGERQPCLATEWTHSPDYLEWTYRLRPNVRWHDGVPVTVDDVKFTHDLHARVDSPVYGLRTECTVHDESTFAVRGSGWTRGADSYMSIVPKHLLADLDYQKWYEWDFWLRPVGNGPYRYVRYEPGTMVELEANPDYYKGKPSIERVVLKFTGQAGLPELLSGNVDTLHNFNLSQLPAIANDARFTTYWGGPDFWGLTVIVWQNEHHLFQDLDVRRALSLAINRRELLHVLNLPNLSLADGVYTVRQVQRGEMSASEPRYDPAEARQLLDNAGWRPRSRDGVRERGGQDFRFTALVATRQELTTKAALYVQDQLRRVGVHAEIQPLEQDAFVGRVKTGEFEAAIGRQNGDLLERFFGDQSGRQGRVRVGPRTNPSGYQNPQLTRLYERLKTTADPGVVDEAYREMSDLVRRDQPLGILFCPVGATVVHRRVKGLSGPWHTDPLQFTEDLWLEKER